MILNAQKTGYAVGLVLGGFHFLWAILVGLGIAQAIWDFILWAHMIHFSYTVGPFEWSAATILIVLTTLIGYALGWVFAVVWNRLHRGA